MVACRGLERVGASVAFLLLLIGCSPIAGGAETDNLLVYEVIADYHYSKELVDYSWVRSFSGGGDYNGTNSASAAFGVGGGFRLGYELNRTYVFRISVPRSAYPSEPVSISVDVDEHVASHFRLVAQAWLNLSLGVSGVFEGETGGIGFFENYTVMKDLKWDLGGWISGEHSTSLAPQEVFTVPLQYSYLVADLGIDVSPAVAPNITQSQPGVSFSLTAGETLERVEKSVTLTQEVRGASLETSVHSSPTTTPGKFIVSAFRSAMAVAVELDLGVNLAPWIAMFGQRLWSTSIYVPLGIEIILDPGSLATEFPAVARIHSIVTGEGRVLVDPGSPAFSSRDPHFFNVSVRSPTVFIDSDLRGVALFSGLISIAAVVLFLRWRSKTQKAGKGTGDRLSSFLGWLLALSVPLISLAAFLFSLAISASRNSPYGVGIPFAVGVFAASLASVSPRYSRKDTVGVLLVLSSVFLLVAILSQVAVLAENSALDESQGYPLTQSGIGKWRGSGYDLAGAPVDAYVQHAIAQAWPIPVSFMGGYILVAALTGGFASRDAPLDNASRSTSAWRGVFRSLTIYLYVLVPVAVVLALAHMLVIGPGAARLGGNFVAAAIVAFAAATLAGVVSTSLFPRYSWLASLVLLLASFHVSWWSLALAAPSAMANATPDFFGHEADKGAPSPEAHSWAVLWIVLFVVAGSIAGWLIGMAIAAHTPKPKTLRESLESYLKYSPRIVSRRLSELYPEATASNLASAAFAFACLGNLVIGTYGMTFVAGAPYRVDYEFSRIDTLGPGMRLVESLYVPETAALAVQVHSSLPVKAAIVRVVYAPQGPVTADTIDSSLSTDFSFGYGPGTFQVVGTVHVVVERPAVSADSTQVQLAFQVKARPPTSFADVYVGSLIVAALISSSVFVFLVGLRRLASGRRV